MSDKGGSSFFHSFIFIPTGKEKDSDHLWKLIRNIFVSQFNPDVEAYRQKHGMREGMTIFVTPAICTLQGSDYYPDYTGYGYTGEAGSSVAITAGVNVNDPDKTIKVVMGKDGRPIETQGFLAGSISKFDSRSIGTKFYIEGGNGGFYTESSPPAIREQIVGKMREVALNMLSNIKGISEPYYFEFATLAGKCYLTQVREAPPHTPSGTDSLFTIPVKKIIGQGRCLNTGVVLANNIVFLYNVFEDLKSPRPVAPEILGELNSVYKNDYILVLYSEALSKFRGIRPLIRYHQYCWATGLVELQRNNMSLDGERINHSGQGGAHHFYSKWKLDHQYFLGTDEIEKAKGNILSIPGGQEIGRGVMLFKNVPCAFINGERDGRFVLL